MTPPIIVSQDAGELEWLLLPDLSSQEPSVFGTDGTQLYRVKNWVFDSNLKEYSCFFGNGIIKDGNLMLCSRLDPLYVILGLLDQRNSMFFGLDDLLSSDEFPDLAKLVNFLSLDKLLMICDVNDEIQDDSFIRINHEKTLNWLKNKVGKVVGQDCTSDYASRLLSDYISPKWLKELRQSLGLKDLKDTNENYYTDQIVIKKRSGEKETSIVKKVFLTFFKKSIEA